jgi:hypothetical protein
VERLIIYYGHKRKFIAHDPERSKKRCPLERIPCERLDNVVINRLKFIVKDRKTLARIVNEASSTRGNETHLPEIVHILQIKESELKGLKDKIGHLAEQIAKLPGDITESLIEKLREYETQKRQIVEHIEKIRAEREGKVIDLDIAHRFLRIFDASFQKRPVLEQRGLIEEVVHSLIVGKNEVKAFYYVLGSPDCISTNLGSAEDEDISGPAQPWSPVRPGFGLVETAGIEPASESHPSLASTCLAGDLD